MRIVRGMFEAEVTAEYLRNHPEKLQDYVDFLYVSIMYEIRFLEEKDPQLLAEIIPADALKSVKEQYAKVEHRFKTKRGYDRGSWCDESLYEMADDSGRKDAYSTLYHSASGIHHFDVTGQAAQFDKDTLDVDIAPSAEWLESAMFQAHSSVLSAMKDFNEEAALGFDEDIEAAGNVFREVWKARLEPDS